MKNLETPGKTRRVGRYDIWTCDINVSLPLQIMIFDIQIKSRTIKEQKMLHLPNNCTLYMYFTVCRAFHVSALACSLYIIQWVSVTTLVRFYNERIFLYM